MSLNKCIFTSHTLSICLLAIFLVVDTGVDLYHAVPVRGSVKQEGGVKQGKLDKLYTPRWTYNGFHIIIIIIAVAGSRVKVQDH